MTPRIACCGDCAVTVYFENRIDPDVNDAVVALDAALKSRQIEGLIETVPAYRELTVVYDPLRLSLEALNEAIETCLTTVGDTVSTEQRIVEIPVVYGGRYGPDIETVASHNGLTVDEVVALHTGQVYRVYMLGFTPGFPYLGGLDKRLFTPRLKNPRLSIEAGSVGIAGEQTGIYPLSSPGGWQLIGRSPKKLFDLSAQQPFQLVAGDFVKFISITEEEMAAYESKWC